MAKLVKDIHELRGRARTAQEKYRRRNQLADLCEEIYMLEYERKSGYMNEKMVAWRDRVSPEYWEVSAKGQNIVDVMTAILTGHPPLWRCSIPGDTMSTIPSRAEMFLNGAFRNNSLRQQKNVLNTFVFKMVKHGAAAMRITWIDNPPDVEAKLMENPEDPKGSPVVVHLHDEDTFPLQMDVIDIRNIFPGARGAMGRPFSEIFYVQHRTVADVLHEWDGRGSTKEIENSYPRDSWETTEDEYLEWWCRGNDGDIYYSISFGDHWIVRPTDTEYPDIPFVIGFYKEGDERQGLEYLPFLFPVIHSLDKLEYIHSRAFRQIDMFANMNPYHSGSRPVQGVDGTWGKIIELDEREDIKFPNWPGQPPDVWREMEQLENTIGEGSFSQAMFGQVSSRVSGYALSQVIGSDTLRTDTPRANLEMALTSMARLMFKLMQVYSITYMGVTSQVRNKKMTAILSGEETKQLITEAFVKPKQTSDEVRMATLGAQIAANPNKPVSMRYILETFFNIPQPEEELNRLLDEEAMRDPVVRLMAIHSVLEASGSPYAELFVQKIQEAIGQQAGAGKPGAGPPGQPGPGGEGPVPEELLSMLQGAGGVGMGMPQSLQGNPPQPGASGNPTEENGPTPGTNMFGGPMEGMI